MTTTLVTGGAGFIGSHLCRYLLDCGDDVVVLDDLSTGRLASIPTGPHVRVITADLAANPDLATTVGGVDRVFHLAAAVGVGLLARRPNEIIARNVVASDRLLAACAHASRPVLVTSSSEVYGRAARSPLHEDADIELGPSTSARWSYACSKLMVEHAAFAYARTHGLRFVIARPFNTVGPGQSGDYGMVIPRLVAQALAGEDLTVFGDGTQSRCFCHVADVVGALPRLLDAPAASCRVVNIGSDLPVSINALAGRILALTASRSRIRHVPFASVYGADFEDIEARLPDLTRARQLIGFRPCRDLDRILTEVIASMGGKTTGAAP
ncbi:MAG: NAD-dependent epimerase/dehydratase family protein [Gammaproteobacteria bacterium]